MSTPPPSLPRLVTTRCVLRLGTTADADAIARYYLDNRAALAPYEPRRPEGFYTPAYWQIRVALNRSQFEQQQSACFFLFTPDEQRVIGALNLTSISSYPFYAAQLGYSLADAYWGQGYMREALTTALAWAFEALNLHRIAANHLPDNQRSAALLAKLGFQREGYAKDYLLIDGVWRDHVLNALTRQDWVGRDLHVELIANGHGHIPQA
ncbi:MAG: ribosomal protein S5-alanine N-acetyltransferase [Burkholderiales bacterium]|nr:ribosomal protein S5-alanine N-acetyltransferase [Burkholderiales bacterium]